MSNLQEYGAFCTVFKEIQVPEIFIPAECSNFLTQNYH